jgi:4-amino-4-deoxychorismate lyase
VASAAVQVADRGLSFGDGVFRTLAVRAGRALNWQWHYRRLLADCELLGLQAPAAALLLQEIAQVAPGDAVAKVVVTRGLGAPGYAIDREAPPTRIVAAFPAPVHNPAFARDGVRVRRCALVLGEQPRLAGAKTLNRLENVLARSEWDDPAVAEGLLADASGRVIEGTRSNLFVVTRGVLATPDLARCGVVGAQRERARQLLQEAGIECRVRDLEWRDVESADEIFLTNSLIGAWPVARLDERRWTPGPVVRRLQALIGESDAGP